MISREWEALARLTAAVTRPHAIAGEAQVAGILNITWCHVRFEDDI